MLLFIEIIYSFNRLLALTIISVYLIKQLIWLEKVLKQLNE